MESFINTGLFAVENIEVPKANGAVKLFQGLEWLYIIINWFLKEKHVLLGWFMVLFSLIMQETIKVKEILNFFAKFIEGALEVTIKNTEEKDIVKTRILFYF